MFGSDTYILNLMGAFEFNHFAIRPQSGWFFVSHALAHSTGPKGIIKKRPPFINGVAHRLLLVKVTGHKALDNRGCIEGFKTMEASLIDFSVANSNLWTFCKIEHIHVIELNILLMLTMNEAGIAITMLFDSAR